LAAAIKEGGAPNIYMLAATNGRRWNIQIVWITQRPQNLDWTCYKTAPVKIWFRLDEPDEMYLKRMGIKLPPREGYQWVMH
jgi:phage terminase large subunit GpA-like protein